MEGSLPKKQFRDSKTGIRFEIEENEGSDFIHIRAEDDLTGCKARSVILKKKQLDNRRDMRESLAFRTRREKHGLTQHLLYLRMEKLGVVNVVVSRTGRLS